MPATLAAIPLDAVLAAQHRLRGVVQRTPLLSLPRLVGEAALLVKLENLQPIGSFKLRGAANAIALADPATLVAGVYTASAGNMAQGVAWCARERGIPCRVIVPESAPANKLAAIERLGGRVTTVPFDRWWQVMVDHGAPDFAGLFIHPFADAGVMAGNGTIALELLDDDAALDTVLVPWGGGGLACGIAATIRARRPDIRVFAVEVAGAAPLTASLAAGHPVSIAPVRSFIDGIGGRGVAAEMWPMARQLLAGVLVVTVEQVAAAVRRLAAEAHVIAEGAGAAAVAAAMVGVPGAQRIACIVSGGNIDAAVFATILGGNIP